MFEPISIDPGQGINTDFIDAGLHSNNPMGSLLEDARECFGDNRRMWYILSTGPGYPGVIGLSEKSIHAANLIGALKNLATDSIPEHNRWATPFTDSDNLYHRSNLDHGAEMSRFRSRIRSTTCEHMSKHTCIKEVPVRKAIDFVVMLLWESWHDESFPTIPSVLRG